MTRRLLAGVLLLLTVASSAEAATRASFRRVFIVVLENTAYADALAQPFLGELAGRGALLANFFAEAHPSFPNYVALTAGSTYGLSAEVTVDVPHIGDLLEAAGRTWKVYAEGYPGDCFLGSSAGTYVRRHVPFLSFLNVQADPARCQRIVDASGLAADIDNGTLPDYSLYVPDLNDSGHDTGVAFAAQWLAQTFGPRLADPRFLDGMLFVVTFDESSQVAPNHVYTVLYGPGVVPGSTSTSSHDHYSLLRTIEDALRLGTLGQHDAQASAIADVWRPPSGRDFNGDGKADILLRHVSGGLTIWLMDGTAITGGSAGGASTDWAVAGVEDFDGDGKADILWRHLSGGLGLWFMNGTALRSAASAGGAPPEWVVAGVGDFDGDGKADILLRHPSGGVTVLQMNGAAVTGIGSLGGAATDWAVAGVGDFDGDGKADILWRHTSGGVGIWLMNGAAIAGSVSAGGMPPEWTVQKVGDFNGDGMADILWRNTSGRVKVWLMNGAAIASAATVGVASLDWAIAGARDLDGDGKADILWRHTSGGVGIWFMNGTAATSHASAGGAPPDWVIQ